jgi:hypothetical protein
MEIVLLGINSPILGRSHRQQVYNKVQNSSFYHRIVIDVQLWDHNSPSWKRQDCLQLFQLRNPMFLSSFKVQDPDFPVDESIV